MKFIKIFLASSIVEFEKERRQLGDFVRSLNDTYVKRGIYFELIMCEDLTNSLAAERKQQEYNQSIRESQYFYVLFGRNAGAYTVEEFDVALEQFQASGSPRIFTYFLNLPEGERPEQSVTDFMERLDKQLGHYYSTFVHMDAIKLNLLLELVRDPDLNSQVKFEDGQAVLGDQPVLSLEHVPLYSRNETVQQLLKRQEALNEEFAKLALQYGKNPADRKLLEKMMKLGEERAGVADTLHQMEMDMLSLCNQAAEKRQSGKILSWREKKAIECVDLGDYEGAKNILRDAQWEKEIEHTEEQIEAARQSIREYISGKQVLIAALMATGLNEETVEEIYAVYERCCTLAKNHGVGMEVLYGYTDFLYRQCQFPKAIAVGEELYRYEKENAADCEADLAKLTNLLGKIYGRNREYDSSMEKYQEARELYAHLAQKEPGGYRAEQATLYNSMANQLRMMNRQEEAEELFLEALRIQRKLAEENPETYEKELASVCNNYGIFLKQRNRLEEAEAVYREGLEIRRRGSNDASGKEVLARTMSNLSNVLRCLERLDEAETLGREALEIRRSLTLSNPERHQTDLAESCNNLALILEGKNRLEEAESLHREGAGIWERVREINPKAYQPFLEMSYENLAEVLRKEGRLKEALNIYNLLVQANQEAYRPGKARLSFEFAANLWDQGETEKAEVLYGESFEIYSLLAGENKDVWEPYLSAVCDHIHRLKSALGKWEEAEIYCREALRVDRNLAASTPGEYWRYQAESSEALGEILMRSPEKFGESRERYEEALKLYEAHPDGEEQAQRIRGIFEKYYGQER